VIVLVVVITPADVAMVVAVVAIAVVITIRPVIGHDAPRDTGAQQGEEGSQSGETTDMAHAVYPMAVSMG
jgi:hypothetical protein